MFVSYGEHYFSNLEKQNDIYEEKAQEYKDACEREQKSQIEKKMLRRH